MKNKVNNSSKSNSDNNIEEILMNIKDKFINTDLSPHVIEQNHNNEYKKFSFRPIFRIGCIFAFLLFSGFAFKHFLFTNSAYDSGVNNADQNGYIQPLNVSCIKDNIRINLLGVINDGERVLLQAEIFQDEKELKFSEISVSGIQLVTSTGESYNFLRFGGGNTQKSTEANIIEFPAKITENQMMTLRIRTLNNIVGNWELNFPIQGENSITYPCDFSQKIDDMNFQVGSITVSKTQIKVTVVITGELAIYRTNGYIFNGKEKGMEIRSQGRNTGILNQVSEEITYEYISLEGVEKILMDLDFVNPNDPNSKSVQYHLNVPLNMEQ